MIYILVIINIISSIVGITFFYKYLNYKNILDIPNERSMHNTPKVRGGGAPIIVVYSLTIFSLYVLDFLTFRTMSAMTSGTVILGTVGWVDDRKNLNAIVRLFFQVLSASLLIYFLGTSGGINILGYKFVLIKYLIIILLLLFITWMINLFNFMDGIDGIAISQAILPNIFIGAMALIFMDRELLFISVTAITSMIFFYKYNWSPSKMFMGDVLSGFLGFYFAFLTLYLNGRTEHSIVIIPILTSVFIFDATYVLIRRLLAGEKVWEAHSTHFYQQFAKLYGHKKVTITVIIINLLLFIPAYFSILWPKLDLIILLLTYLLLFLGITLLKKIFLRERSN